MRKRTLRLVTPGTQANGQVVTAEQLAQAVASHKADARPPVTLGHPKDSATLALGRVDAPRIRDGALVLEIHYTPVLEALEDQGYLEGFSAGLYPHPQTGRYYIHHVAALGELPPAADTRVLAAADLGAFEAAKLITLAATIEDTMTPDDIKKLLADAVKPFNDKLVELEAKIAAKPSAKPDGDGASPGQGGEDPEARKQLAVALGTIKADRIAAIAAGLKAKGLTDEQAKPLLDLLRGAEPIALADDKPDGVYAHAKAFAEGLPDVGGADADLTKPLELADGQGKTYDPGELARKF